MGAVAPSLRQRAAQRVHLRFQARVQRARGGADQHPFSRLRDWRETAVAVRVAGKGRLGDEEVWIVRVESDLLPPLTRYVSTRTGLLLREEAWLTVKTAGTVPLTVRYEDYREVAGVKVPFRLTSESRLTGKQIVQFTEAKPNAAIRPDAFALPSD